LSPVIQGFFGLNLRFAGDGIVIFALSTVLIIFGGKPFILGALDELKKKRRR
jgi:Cu2+-exporting ATPase